MAHHAPVKVSPTELKNAQEFYDSFIKFAQKLCVGVGILLILLALIFT